MAGVFVGNFYLQIYLYIFIVICTKIISAEVIQMFEIKNKQKSNKTIRMPDDLIEKLQTLADKNDISFNQLVVQCCEYALDNMLKGS